MTVSISPDDRLLTLKQVREIVPKDKATIYRCPLRGFIFVLTCFTFFTVLVSVFLFFIILIAFFLPFSCISFGYCLF